MLEPEAAAQHPQIRGRGFHVVTDAGLVAGLPVRLAGAGPGATWPSQIPEPGAHPEGFSPR